MAFQSAPGEACVDAEPDPWLDAYRRRFPPEPQHLRYCSTCSLREFDDCADRQLFWLDQERSAREA
ncbi:MAG: hypothetical protein ACOH2Q_11830 [Rhodococcus sp. (in: high G+C Gram-positive bacteria)]